jgi:secreted trypsin-like serine protease
MGCGGSLIARRVVLTAAHCVVNPDYTPKDPPTNKVLINGYDLLTGAIPEDSGYIAASSYVIHQGYNSATVENDIALWFLPFPIGEDENFKFATLNEDPTVPADGEELFVSGWGRTVDGDPSSVSPVLLGTNLGYITNEQYQAITGNNIFDGMMYAGGDGRGTGLCQGDSGGPLMIANGDGPAMDPPLQVGINSFVLGSCNSNNPLRDKPAGFTRVSSYIDWIHSTACEKVGEFCPSSSKSGKGKSKAYKNESGP